jgi:hypothetical protein
MVFSAGNDTRSSLMLIEAGLTTIIVAAAFALPRIASQWFARIEQASAQLARKKASVRRAIREDRLGGRTIS